jgi:hypothetical protein
MVSRNMICSHCQTKGTVRTKEVKIKKGISGGKVMGGYLLEVCHFEQLAYLENTMWHKRDALTAVQNGPSK